MAVLWVIVLVIYGLCFGFHEVQSLLWWLCLPFGAQDCSDLGEKRK
jgi:hypothetical protein